MDSDCEQGPSSPPRSAPNEERGKAESDCEQGQGSPSPPAREVRGREVGANDPERRKTDWQEGPAATPILIPASRVASTKMRKDDDRRRKTAGERALAEAAERQREEEAAARRREAAKRCAQEAKIANRAKHLAQRDAVDEKRRTWWRTNSAKRLNVGHNYLGFDYVGQALYRP